MSSKVSSINFCVSYPQITEFKQVGVREKNDRNEINSCGGPSRLAMHLRDHLIITSGYPFWYCFSGFRFHFPG